MLSNFLNTTQLISCCIEFNPTIVWLQDSNSEQLLYCIFLPKELLGRITTSGWWEERERSLSVKSLKPNNKSSENYSIDSIKYLICIKLDYFNVYFNIWMVEKLRISGPRWPMASDSPFALFFFSGVSIGQNPGQGHK